MLVLGSLLIGLAWVLDWLLMVYSWLLIGRALVSWVNADPRKAVVRVLIRVTDPPLGIVRRMLPSSLRYFPVDVAFLVVLGLVLFARYVVVPSLFAVGQQLRLPSYVTSARNP